MAEIYLHDAGKYRALFPSLSDQNVASGVPVRQRRSRTMFTDVDIARLEAAFVADPYPDINAREEMADAIGVAEARIQTWFQNKRSRTRRKINNRRLAGPNFTPSSSSATVPTFTSLPLESTSSTASSPFTSSTSSPFPSPSRDQENVKPSIQVKASPKSTPRSNPKKRLSLDKALSSSPSRSEGTPSPPGSGIVNHTPRSDVKEEHAGNDSGVLDLSSRSNEDSSVTSPPFSMPGKVASDPMVILPPSSTGPKDAGRTFFTPWAPTVSAKPATEPNPLTGTPLFMASLARFPMLSPLGFPSPWMYGFTPTYNSQEKSYFLQPLPSSPFLQYMADVVPPSPRLSPTLPPQTVNAVTTVTAASVNTTPQTNRSAPGIFLYPNTSCITPSTSKNTSAPVTSSPHQPSDGRVTSSSSLSSSLPEDLSESPGSDVGSRSSGYDSRENDSPINVCD